MKKQLLTLIALLFTTASFAQKKDTTLFNGVKKIIVTNSLSAKANYQLAGQTMLKLGYNVGLKDSEFFQISTEPVKVVGQGSTHILSIYAVSSDGKIVITGKTKNLASIKIVSFQDQETAYDIMEYKRLNSISKGVYFRLVDFAKAFEPKTITYSE